MVMYSNLAKALFITLVTAFCAQVFAASAIFYPKPGGVICDRKGGFCADDQGVSVAITEMELGPKASKNLMDQINAVGMQDFDATTFTMSGGLHCEIKKKKCFTNKFGDKVDANATKALFGK